MSWIKAIDKSLEHWKDVFPDLSNFCLSDELEFNKPTLDSSLKSEDIFPEPRQISSSELSEHSSEKKNTVWTAEEDLKLMNVATEHNFQWEEVARSLPNTSPRSAQNRWNALNENKHKVEWTKEQDNLIVKLYQKFGGHWKQIANYFPGISSATIKNRFYGSIKRKMTGSPKSCDEGAADGAFDAITKPLGELTEEEKRSKITELYKRVFEIQKNLESTKTQILELAVKAKKNENTKSPEYTENLS